MLKVPDHQVAGHQALRGQLGPQIDESGRFYKPVQEDDRGSQELAFYEALNSSFKIKKQILRSFPAFYGTQNIKASDGSGLHPHLILQDITSDYVKPCIIDIKIGSRTWYPQASEDYVAKCLRKDRGSTSGSLGLRISGLQIYQGEEFGYWKPDKKVVQKYTVNDVRSVLTKFSSSIPIGDLSGILGQLKELKSWFEDQTDFHFYSCSILLIYNGQSETKGGNPHSTVKLIDFAHVFEGNGAIDYNFMGGLCSLIKFISETQTPPTSNSKKLNDSSP